MRAVVQRVKRAEVRVPGQAEAIGPGMVVLAGLEAGDTPETCRWVAAKIASLRIFEDGEGRMNRSLEDTGGEILVISQFTLAGSVERGRRPSFDGAMAPEPARALFGVFVEALRGAWPRLREGFFQEHMEVELVNDGPATFVVER